MKAAEQLNNEHITEQVSADDIAKFQTQIAGQISAIMASAYLKTCEGKYCVAIKFAAHINWLAFSFTKNPDDIRPFKQDLIRLEPPKLALESKTEWVLITQKLDQQHQFIKDLD